MAFPQTPIAVTTQLFYDGAWNTVSTSPKGDGVRYEDGIQITRGRSDEQSVASPSTAVFKLGNVSNTYSPKNPSSNLYGRIGNNTPARHKIAPSTGEQVALSLAGASGPFHGARVSTPDHADFDITGDMGVRIDVDPGQWRWAEWNYRYNLIDQTPAGVKFMMLAGKWFGTDTVDERSWVFAIRQDGYLRFRISTDGTTPGAMSYLSTEPIPVATGRLALRATIDVDNGAAGHDVRFYTADTIDGIWTQLGDTVTTAGTTSIFSSSADLVVGAGHEGSQYFTPGGTTYTGLVYGFQLYASVDGTAQRAELDFTAYDTFTHTFTDSDGHTWNLAGAAEFINTATRHCGEIPDWSPDWDPTGSDVWVPVTSSGVIRRLQQGDKPLDSPIFKSWTSNDFGTLDTIVGYWPCEDENSATSIASGIEGVEPMKLGIIEGFPIRDTDFGAYSGFAGSKPITEFGITTAFADLPVVADTGFVQVNFLMRAPSNGVDADVQIVNVTTSGEGIDWAVELNDAGNMRVRAFSDGGTALLTPSYVVFDANGRDLLVTLDLKQDGSDIDWAIIIREQGSDYDAGFSGTLSSHTLGAPQTVYLSRSGDASRTAIGHVVVRNTESPWGAVWSGPSDTYEFGGFTDEAFNGHDGERAGYRIIRTCQENGVPVRFIGDPDDTPFLGPQPDGNIIDVLEDAATTDGGILAEAREFLGFEYISRKQLYNQTAVLSLDYAGADFSEVPRPKADDRYIRNDVTVQRRDGSSRRSVQTEGPLNVNDPRDDPQGVGLYDEKVTLSLHTDGQIADQARWRRHLGTVDEERYPSFVINLARRTGYIDTVLGLQLGQRIAATNMPAWVKPEAVSQLLRGYKELIRTFEHSFNFTTTAAGGYQIAIIGGDDGTGATVDGSKYDTLGSEVGDAIDTTATEFLVSTTKGPRWVEAADLAGQFPFDVLAGGEAMTVSAIEHALDDTFTRTETDGWGTPDVGPDWTTAGAAASDFAVGSGVGTMTLTNTGVERTALLGETAADGEVHATVSVDQVATGAWITAQAVLRRVDASNHLIAQIEFKDTGNVGIAIYEVISGSAAQLDAIEIGSYSGTEQFSLRMRAIGNTVRVKMWRTADGEDTSIFLNTTDATLLDPGDMGVRAIRDAGNINTDPVVSFDDVSIPNPQRFTVTRSVNGVTKAHGAGTPVRLRYPTNLGL